MRILAIETSCDETAVAVIGATGGAERPSFRVRGNALYSQAKKHAPFGGVYPNLARREHQQNLVPLLKAALAQAGLLARESGSIDRARIARVLEREPGLLELFIAFIPTVARPDIDLIAVTVGPGLEPALWVGINFAKALGEAWNIRVVPVNHMEGHIVSVLLNRNEPSISKSQFPMVALLVSGGHTELVFVRAWLDYEIIGETRDDAVGEAFDKVARMLGLPYPGGPAIASHAEQARKKGATSDVWKLPRPMIDTVDCDMSFSGLKTAVLYRIRGRTISDDDRQSLAREFEDAAFDVLVRKTERALDIADARALILAGGVAASVELRRRLQELASSRGIELLVPARDLSTDNAIMIGIAAYIHHISQGPMISRDIGARGTLPLAEKSP